MEYDKPWMPAAVVRIIAVLLLLSGAADYLSFDRTDLFESMNAVAAVKGAADSIPGMRHSRPAGVKPSALPDDACLFCGIGLPAAAVVMHFKPLVSEFNTHYVLTNPAFLLDSPYPPPKFLLS
jgi:hypothetical protein